MEFAICVNLGGTHTAEGAVTTDGKIIHLTERDNVAHEPNAAVEENGLVGKQVLALGGEKDCIGIGIGAPGNIDDKSVTINWSPNFQRTAVPLKAMLERRIK